jgi:hypothetical protein
MVVASMFRIGMDIGKLWCGTVPSARGRLSNLYACRLHAAGSELFEIATHGLHSVFTYTQDFNTYICSSLVSEPCIAIVVCSSVLTGEVHINIYVECAVS